MGSGVSNRGSNAGILVQLSQQLVHRKVHTIDGGGSTIFRILGFLSSTLTSTTAGSGYRLGITTTRNGFLGTLLGRSFSSRAGHFVV